MTHDELIAKINEELATDYEDPYGNVPLGLNALRAVAELHRPEEQNHKEYEKCWNCSLLYPCPTIQAIEKELGSEN